MKYNEEDDIFGEIVLPSPSPLSKQLVEKLKKGQKQRESRKNKSGIDKKITLRKPEREKITKSHCVSSKTNRSTDASTRLNEQEKKRKKMKVKELDESDNFWCWKCGGLGFTKKCQLCKGQDKVNGNDKMTRFMEYIMEFKLGIRDQYNNERGSSKEKPNQFCQDVLRGVISSQMARKSMPVYHLYDTDEDCQLANIRHDGYICDYCQVQPIVGTRYHCQLCNDDFDLCEKCYKMKGHTHKMKKIGRNQLQQRLELLKEWVSQSKYDPEPQTVSWDSRKIFCSSIH